MTSPRFIPPPPSGTAPKTPRAPRRPGILLLAVGAVAFAACEDPQDPAREEHRVVGYVDLTGDRAGKEPQIPETATVSVPVPITLWTTGGGCHSGGDTEVSVDGHSAVVTPYDTLAVGDFDCSLVLNVFEHKTSVVFDEPGTAQIVLRYSTGGGRRPEAHDGAGRKVYTVEVQPAG